MTARHRGWFSGKTLLIAAVVGGAGGIAAWQAGWLTADHVRGCWNLSVQSVGLSDWTLSDDQQHLADAGGTIPDAGDFVEFGDAESLEPVSDEAVLDGQSEPEPAPAQPAFEPGSATSRFMSRATRAQRAIPTDVDAELAEPDSATEADDSLVFSTEPRTRVTSAPPRALPVDDPFAEPPQSRPRQPIQRTGFFEDTPTDAAPGNEPPAGAPGEFAPPRVARSIEGAGQSKSKPGSKSAAGLAPKPIGSEPAPVSDTPLLQLPAINALIEQGDYVGAQKELSRIYWKQPSQREALRPQLDELAALLYFSPQPHVFEPYVIQPGDQLRLIAGKYKLSWEYLARLNRVDPRKIRTGQRLKVVQGPFSALVIMSRYELIVHLNGSFVKSYRVGIGKDGSTPIGTFLVKNKVADPTYFGPDGVIKHDDPQNPLGERWIDIGDSYGIHGTIEPDSIGKNESRGCVRMLNSDVEEVYDFLVNGSEVRIQR